MTQKLLVATQNPHKLEEFHQMLRDLHDVEWVSLSDVGLGDMEVEETGTSFEENARIKAFAYQRASGLITFADDSGLEIDALQGAPGVYSARYGSPQARTDADRYQLVLDQLDDVPTAERTGRFVCVIAVALPQHQTLDDVPTVRGTVEGTIGFAPRGTNGFGYDPIFELPDGLMLAELPSERKNQISHRANALRNALPLIRQLLNQPD